MRFWAMFRTRSERQMGIEAYRSGKASSCGRPSVRAGMVEFLHPNPQIPQRVSELQNAKQRAMSHDLVGRNIEDAELLEG